MVAVIKRVCIPLTTGFGWLLILGLPALSDSISVYIGPSPREGERKEKRYTREKMSKQPQPASTASAVGLRAQ